MCRFQHWSCLAPVSLSLSRVSGRWLIAGSTIGAGGCLLSTFIFWHAILDNACDSWFPFISDVGDMNGVSEQAKVYYLFSWLMTVFSVLLFFSMWVVFCTVGERIRTAPPNSFASCCGCGCRWVDVFFQICNYIALMAALAGCSFLGLLVNICTTCSCELHAAATGVFFIGVLVACAIWTVLCLIIPKFRPSTNGCTRYCQLFYVCKPQEGGLYDVVHVVALFSTMAFAIMFAGLRAAGGCEEDCNSDQKWETVRAIFEWLAVYALLLWVFLFIWRIPDDSRVQVINSEDESRAIFRFSTPYEETEETFSLLNN
eukprot:TRINITY_DN3394_c0_g1_i3.p1 TRINITY_DN3394_c0_g1~~TRINITY_DN3394_c0_g1_i3.p1  ORF type:complete len:314 (-),score=-4.11 TRINITY_DN3394_c0_g1_i3:16-957(-)